MNESSDITTKLFECSTTVAKTPQITPSKRRQITDDFSGSGPTSASKRRGIRFSNQDEINSKILIQDTPTPFMSRQKSVITNPINIPDTQKQPCFNFTKANRIIPNTPVNKNNPSQIPKKSKKLFDNNALLLEEEDLPGDANVNLIIKKTTKSVSEQPKKMSSIFKPKSKVNNKENDSDLGCDLSLETLEKRQRRRNPLIARLSDIEKELANEKEKEKPQAEKSPPSSPILIKSNPLHPLAEVTDFDFIKSWRTPKTSEKTQQITLNSDSRTKTAYNNCSSFTNVTQQQFNNSLSDNSTQDINEHDIDLILFDGLKLDSEKSLNDLIFKSKNVRLVDKTNTKLDKYRSSSQKSRRTTGFINKRSTSATYQIKKKFFPSKINTFHLTVFDLDEDQIEKVKFAVNNLNSLSKKVNAVISKEFNMNTTHLILDFERTLDNLNISKKFMLILAALKNCKLIRQEWPVHSYKKDKWLDEKSFLFESYFDSDLDQYDQSDFDVRLFKFVKGLDLTSKVSLFSTVGNIYIQNEAPDDSDESQDEEEEDQESSFCVFNKKARTYDYIYELISKCEGLITSRIACADLVILIDKQEDSKDKLALVKERNRLKKNLNILQDSVNKCRKKKKIQVVSSNWIMDCLLENTKLDKDAYEIGWLQGNK